MFLLFLFRNFVKLSSFIVSSSHGELTFGTGDSDVGPPRPIFPTM